MAFWACVFTPGSWSQFKAAGGGTAGFREKAWSRAQRMTRGDVLLCYLADAKCWFALLTVTGEAYWSTQPEIWHGEPFPARIPVEVEVELPETRAVSAGALVDELPRLRRAREAAPGAWAGFLRGAPRLWPDDEGEIVRRAILVAASE
jgi:hypothetical protein